MFLRSFLAVSTISIAAGCSGPESEPPVDLQPGRYDVTASAGAGAFGPAAGKSKQRSICIMPDEAKDFASDPLPLRDAISPACKIKTVDRKGNAFSGTRECVAAPESGITLTITLGWKGSMKADGFEIDGDLKSTGAVNRSGQFQMSGKRTGDC
jgi:Protein of unknown function (DUF3617)